MINSRRNSLVVALVVTVLGTIGVGFFVDRHLNPPVSPSAVVEGEKPQLPQIPKRDVFREHFTAAAKLLAANQFEDAIKMLHEAQRLNPHVPDIYVNYGFAHLGLKNPEHAVEDFEKALSMNPKQLNAYYGLAIALEEQGDVEGAVGAMNTYIHLTPDDEPFRRKAMSAVWEWNKALEEKRAAEAKSAQVDELAKPAEDAK